MTQPVLSREEFRDTMQRLYETTDQGFQAINERLDLLNGRVLKGEIDRENHRTRIIGVEKELLASHRHRRRNDDPDDEPSALALTKREYALMSLGIAIIGVLLKVVEFLGEKLWHLVMAGK